MIQWMLAIWSLVSLPFLNLACTSESSWFTYWLEKSYLDLFLIEYSWTTPVALIKQASKPLWSPPTRAKGRVHPSLTYWICLDSSPWTRKEGWVVMVSIMWTMKLMGYSSLPSTLYSKWENGRVLPLCWELVHILLPHGVIIQCTCFKSD